MSNDNSTHSQLVSIDGMPHISELFSSLLRQAQLAGLFVAYYGGAPNDSDEYFLKKLGPRLPFLNALTSVLESYLPGKFSIAKLPAIANRAHWANPKTLGGYLSLNPTDLLASYYGCWQHAVQYPDSVHLRFIRLAFWYWRESGDFFAALQLLFDLGRAGFFLRAKDFLWSAMVLIDAYTLDFNVSEVSGLDFSAEKSDELLFKKLERFRDGSHSEDKVQEVVDWIADSVIEAVDQARQSTNADEWLSRQVSLWMSLELLSSVERQHRPLLSTIQRAMASQFEEVLADLGGQAMVTGMYSREGRTLSMNLHGLQAVQLGYHQTYGEDWLDKLMEDRVLAPDALRQTIEAAYAGNPPKLPHIKLPIEWQMVSAELAWPQCAALDVDLGLMRSRDFARPDVEEACLKLGYQREGDTDYKEFTPAAFADARRMLSTNELAGLFEQKGLFDGQANSAIEHLNEIAELYPWNFIVRRELGIRYDQSDEINQAFRQLRWAILLEPTEAMSWHSTSVVLRRMGADDDSLFAAAIAQMLYDKDKQ